MSWRRRRPARADDDERIRKLTADVRRLEHLVENLHRELGLRPADPPAASGMPAEVTDLIRDGRKIEAIKSYRDRTGAGLREAKDAVEAHARDMGGP